MGEQAPVKFMWLDKVCSAEGPKRATSRHVLMALAKHMEMDGTSCFPSTRTLAEETGLSRKAVETNLRHARDDGWLEVTIHGAGGQAWKRHSYRPQFPPKVENHVPHVSPEGGEPRSPRMAEGGEGRSPRQGQKVENHVPHVPGEGGEPRSKGGEPNDLKVEYQVPLSLPVSTPRSLSEKKRTTSSQPQVAGELPTREDVVEEAELGRWGSTSTAEAELGRWLSLARENICYIHGGTERPVRIGDHLVGVGIEINRFKALVEDGRDPEMVARAIRHIPAVTGLQPPVSLARWGDEDDGWAVFQQCEGMALRESERFGPRLGLVEETVGRMAG